MSFLHDKLNWNGHQAQCKKRITKDMIARVLAEKPLNRSYDTLAY